jgi:hypothetical protein
MLYVTDNFRESTTFMNAEPKAQGKQNHLHETETQMWTDYYILWIRVP